MRVATWNVNSVTVRMGKMLDWLPEAAPDVVCLQELKATPEQFPEQAFKDLGYESAINADGRWNGVGILSRVGISDVVTGLAGEPAYDGHRRAPGHRRHLRPASACGASTSPTDASPGTPHYAYKLEWLEALRATVAAELSADQPYAVLGDFNVAPTDSDVWDIKAFDGADPRHPPERAALADLRGLGLATSSRGG